MGRRVFPLSTPPSPYPSSLPPLTHPPTITTNTHTDTHSLTHPPSLSPQQSYDKWVDESSLCLPRGGASGGHTKALRVQAREAFVDVHVNQPPEVLQSLNAYQVRSCVCLFLCLCFPHPSPPSPSPPLPSSFSPPSPPPSPFPPRCSFSSWVWRTAPASSRTTASDPHSPSQTATHC